MHIDPPAAPPLPGSASTPRSVGSRPGAPAPAPSFAPAPDPTSAASAPASAAPGPSTTLRLRTAGGDFDAARVAQLREALAQGRHRVDLGRVADGLVRHLQDLAGPRT